MRVLAKPILGAFWQLHPDSEHALKAWYDEAETATWNSPQDIKNQYAWTAQSFVDTQLPRCA